MTATSGGSGAAFEATIQTVDRVREPDDEVARLQEKVEKQRAHLKGAEAALKAAKERKRI